MTSCNNQGKNSFETECVSIFDSVKIVIPNRYELVCCYPYIIIKSFKSSDRKQKDTLFFSEIDSSFIRFHEYNHPSFYHKILLSPILEDSSLSELDFYIDTTCSLTSILFVEEIDSNSSSIDIEDNFSLIVVGTFYKPKYPTVEIAIYFTKSRFKTNQDDIDSALSILRTLEIGGEKVCFGDTVKFSSTKNYTYYEWMELYDTFKNFAVHLK